MTVGPSSTPRATQGSRHIVLLGGGYAHLQVLAQLAAQPLAGTVVTLVTPYSHQLLDSMLPSFMLGRTAAADFTIAVSPLVQRAGLRWVTHGATALDAAQRMLQLDDGSSLGFDWLSINTSPTQDRARVEQAIPGAREHALFVRPLEAFVALWPRVTELGDSKALRVAVIGAGAGGVEIAFAVRQRLPQAAVTLVCVQGPAATHCTPAVQHRVMALLKQRNITVLQDRAVGIKSGFVQLGCGADLACDVPVLATGSLPPPWLMDSGLALDEHGFIAVDATQRSTSHSQVFAAGDISSRRDLSPARCGARDDQAGPTLAHNLAAVVAGREPKAHQPSAHTLDLLACGTHYAIGSWGRYSFEGRWVSWLKERLDRQFVARYQALK
ncbi:MAG TPA: FAD-dependent oxidoreductase [Rhodoferax sp.]|jgi:NADH dehydrogenase FAD-containing subunit|nr:FAD-dependent oxidoreductase [Rhodoferax sp.]HNV59084.1 FAD-dependent oxidoreductase [Rhodoferax sp.]HPW28879.1 FAD-dependent oxidoreductase [Rhodoferax sp.]